jgi:hypothetical protein
MSQVCDHLLTPGMRVRVANDCVALVELHARTMRGVHGIMARTVFASLKAVQPDIMVRIMDKLLPEFVAAVNQIYATKTHDAIDQETDISAILLQHPAEVVEMLLGIADMRVANLQSQVVRVAYMRLRKFAEREVTDALPHLMDQLRIWMDDTAPRAVPFFE